MRAETRHQLKQDRFRGATIEAAEATVHWSVEHKNTLIWMTGVVVAIAIIVGGSWFYINQQDQKASFDLAQAVRTLQSPVRPPNSPADPENPSFASVKDRATAAQKQLQAIVDKYPHTRSSEFAKYMLASNAADSGDTASAERQYKDIASSHNRDLAGLAKYALAGIYRNSNRNKDAIALYKELIDKPSDTVGKVTAQMELAATYQANGQTTDAKNLFQQIAKENPQTPFAQMAQGKLQEINGK